MKPLRWLAGGLLWILAGLLGLVGGLLSVTVILLPLGIPILMLARRLFSLSTRLVLPRQVRHPAQETARAAKRRGKDTAKAVEGETKRLKRRSRKTLKKARKATPAPAEALTKPRRGWRDRVRLRR